MKLIKSISPSSGNWNKIIYVDDSWYEGYTKNREIREGLGTLYAPDGIVLQRGVWENDELVEILDEGEYNLRVNQSMHRPSHW